MIFGLLIFALYKQLFTNNELKNIIDSIARNFQPLILLLVTVLMFFNWGIEALKWKLLIQKITPIRLIRTFKAVWTGVTLGLFTPNRVGEFGGRILYVPSKFRLKAIVSSLVGSFSQNMASLNIGIICLIIFIHEHYSFNSSTFFIITVICILAGALLMLAYFNIDAMIYLFKKIKVFNRLVPYTNVLNVYSVCDYLQLLVLSLFRYAVYTAQYLIFLKMFGVSVAVSDGIVAIGVIYLTQTLIPTFAIAELLTRGNIAIFFLTFYGADAFSTLAASTCLWLLNLIIPAVIGYIFIIKFNFFKAKQV